MLRLVTAGESHGRCLIGILEGLPAGLAIDMDYIDRQLARRQLGYGRGARMSIEKDRIEVASGIRHGRTLGSPISFIIENKDWANWREVMSVGPAPGGGEGGALTRPRPGHADLAGALKFQTHDARDVLERASARETAARVAAGSLCRSFLRCFGFRIGSHVLAVGPIKAPARFWRLDSRRILELDPQSSIRCADSGTEKRMKDAIDKAKRDGDSLGGVFEVLAAGVPVGLGSHGQWDRRLDAQIACALMSIPAAKAVEIGEGVRAAQAFGSAVHDEIYYHGESRRFFRRTNRAGGIEGGISNGEDIRARVYMKPIPTMRKPLMTADLATKKAAQAPYERSDVCVVPAAAVIGEAMLAIAVAAAFLEKFGGDSMKEVEANFAGFQRRLSDY